MVMDCHHSLSETGSTKNFTGVILRTSMINLPSLTLKEFLKHRALSAKIDKVSGKPEMSRLPY